MTSKKGIAPEVHRDNTSENGKSHDAVRAYVTTNTGFSHSLQLVQTGRRARTKGTLPNHELTRGALNSDLSNGRRADNLKIAILPVMNQTMRELSNKCPNREGDSEMWKRFPGRKCQSYINSYGDSPASDNNTGKDPRKVREGSPGLVRLRGKAPSTNNGRSPRFDSCEATKMKMKPP